MAAQKTLLFSSPYDFSPIGVDAFISRFRRGLDNPAQAPFISYKPQDNFFSVAVEEGDNFTASYFLSQLNWFIIETLNIPDPVDPLIRLRNAIVARQALHQEADNNAELLDLDEDGGSYSEDEHAPQPMQHVTAYWEPKQSDIKILTTIVAESIASLTGCHMYPEPHQSRVRLVGGDFKTALRKLQNMEGLLRLQHQQREFSTARANANILLSTSKVLDQPMRFWPLNDPSRPSFRRIIVEDRATPYLADKFLCETFTSVIDDNELDHYRSPSANLTPQGISETRAIGPSTIWKDYVYKPIGDEINKEPEVSSDEYAKKEVEQPRATVGVNAFIQPRQATQIANWSDAIVDMEDPHLSRPELPTEHESRFTRVPVYDSSDDNDDNESADGDEQAQPAQRIISPASAEVQTEEAKQSSTAAVGRDEVNSLISLANAVPPVAPPSPLTSDYKNGLSIFEADGQEHDLLDANTIISNRLPNPTAIPALSSILLSQPSRGTLPANQYAGHNLFSVLNSSVSSSPFGNPKVSSQTTTSAIVPPKESALQASDGWGVVATKKSKVVTRQATIKTFDGAYSDNARSASNGSHPTTDEPRPTLDTSQPMTMPTQSSSVSAFNGNGLPPAFDPGAYGRPPRASYGSQRRNHGANNNQPPPMPVTRNQRSRGHQYGTTSFRARGGLHRGGGSRQQPEREKLVDVAASHKNTTPLTPPPGLDIQIPPAPTPEVVTSSPATPNLVDEPLENLRPPSRDKSDLMSLSNGTRSYSPRGSYSISSQQDFSLWSESREYENHIPYRNNMRVRDQIALQNLMATKTSTESNVAASTTSGAARKARGDQQQFRSTMSQKAGNPGKKSNGKTKGETADQAKFRKQKAMADAYGGPVTANFTANPTPLIDPIADMSKRKQKLLKQNTLMAETHIDAVQEAALSQITTQLVHSLGPIFEAGRAFTGALQFEIQFGQTMLTSNGQIHADKTASARSWEKLLGVSAKSNGLATSFTNILTTNGEDIDRALEVKIPYVSSRLWDRSSPQSLKLTYEFHCQSKQGSDFWLVIDENGSYEIRNMTLTIGMVAMHCPAHVWDAAAVLKGQENWSDPPPAIVEAISEFVDSVCVLPERQKLALIFRQPKSLEITIRKVLMRRVSRHQCLGMNHRSLLLQATETKTLLTKTHPADKRLWQAFEDDYEPMIRGGNVSYELSIVDQDINESFAQNKNLEAGELTSDSSTGKVMLRKEPMKMMVGITTHMLSKMDWMGFHNHGTLMRSVEMAQAQIVRQQQSLPPTARSRFDAPVIAAGRAQLGYGGSKIGDGGSEMSDTCVGMTAIRTPGTRANTTAAVYEDAEGNYYAIGMGGARIPVTDEAVRGGLQTISEEVGPDDSASQVGVPRGFRSGRPSRPTDGRRGPAFW